MINFAFFGKEHFSRNGANAGRVNSKRALHAVGNAENLYRDQVCGFLKHIKQDKAAWSRYIFAKLQANALHALGDTRPALM
jgi:hypothetical protein